jgi:hypothetical protein
MASLMEILKSVGFKGQALEIAYAIAMAESSGNARAHNPNSGTGDNSYGLFQINMLGGMGPERRKKYGLSSNEELFDPYVNARIAYQMSNGGKNWAPWSTYKRGDYLKFMGQSGANVTNASSSKGSSRGGDGGSLLPAAKERSRAELAEDYGYVLDLFDSVPELKKLFERATKGQWTPQKFQAEVRDTKWWKERPDSARKFLILQSGDPATARQQLDQMMVKITQASGSLGGPTDSKTIRKIALEAIMNAWTDGQIRWNLAKRIDLGGDKRPGEAGENYDKLASYAYDMGIRMSDWWLGEASRQIVAGSKSIQDFEDEIRRNAKGTYSNWAKQIDAGQSVADLASPYFQSMATILELPAGSVNLFDPTIKKALQSKDSQGKSVIKPMWQFENELRNDPRWRKTKNAQDSAMQITRQVLSDFGFVY